MMISVEPETERGFTLVEMIVALFIFSLIAAAGVSILAFSVRAQAAAGERLDDIAALGRLSSSVGADMAQVIARTTRNRAGDPLLAFDGKAVGKGEPFLSFVRSGWTNAEDAPRASLQRVDYRFVDDRLERIPYPMLDGSEAGTASVLLADVDKVGIRYRVGNDWLDIWQPTRAEALPRAIELVVRRKGGAEYRQLFLVGTGY